MTPLFCLNNRLSKLTLFTACVLGCAAMISACDQRDEEHMLISAVDDTDSLYMFWMDASLSPPLRLEALHRLAGKFKGENKDSAEALYRMLRSAADEFSYPLWQVKAWKALAKAARNSGQITLAHAYGDSALVLARSNGFKEEIQDVLKGIGLAYFRDDKYHEAIAVFQEALALSGQLNDSAEMAHCYNNMGINLKRLGLFDSALACYERAFQIRNAIGAYHDNASSYINIGLIHFDRGQLVKAMEYMQKGLKIGEETGNERLIASSLANMTLIYLRTGQFDMAIENNAREFEIVKAAGNQRRIASCQLNYGAIYGKMGSAAAKAGRDAEAKDRFETARGYFLQAASIAEEMGNKGQLAHVLKNLALTSLNLLETGSAKAYINRAMAIYEEAELAAEIAKAKVMLGNISLHELDYSEAIRQCEEGATWAEKDGHPFILRDACSCIYQAYKGMNRHDVAMGWYRRHIEARDSLANEENVRKVTQLEMQYGFDREKDTLAIASYRARLQAEEEISRQRNYRNITIAGLLLLFVGGGGLYNRYRALRTKRKIIEEEKRRSEELLLNILPSETAEELRLFGSAKARSFEHVTVLFADIKGFTEMAENMSAQDLVAEIDHCFKGFDRLLQGSKVEKIKTVGDAYICAGGLPTPFEGSVTAVLDLAVKIQDFMAQYVAERKAEGRPYFEVRLGIHTGPLVAGIVGIKKFAYDIWGDTVNIAARMEEHAETGMINLSQATAMHIRESEPEALARYDVKPRGAMDVKGKGLMEMYALTKTNTP